MKTHTTAADAQHKPTAAAVYAVDVEAAANNALCLITIMAHLLEDDIGGPIFSDPHTKEGDRQRLGLVGIVEHVCKDLDKIHDYINAPRPHSAPAKLVMFGNN